MKVIEKNCGKLPSCVPEIQHDFVDIETIRRRVARIKNEWSLETIRARAKEGERRRDELESLLLDVLTDTSDSEETWDLRQHGFSLVV